LLEAYGATRALMRDNALAILVGFSEMVPTSAESGRQRLPIESMFGGGVWAEVDVMEGEVLGNELVESADDLDLSRFVFCMDFENVHSRCGVDSAREDLDGARLKR
jgi:hypothetical protein